MKDFIVVDTETTGLDIMKGARPFMFIYGKEIAGEFKINFCYTMKEKLKEQLEDPEIIKIFHNAKFDILMLHSIGIQVRGRIYDTMIAAHLLNENASKSLAACSTRYLNEEDRKSDKIKEWFKENKIKQADWRFDMLPKEILEEYAKQDVLATYKLWKILEIDLIEERLWDLFIQECNLCYVLKYMYLKGFKVDVEYLKLQQNLFGIAIKEKEQDIYNLAGTTFDILSNKQLSEILVTQGVELPKTAKGNNSVAESSLLLINSPLVIEILEYRRLNKLLGTYIDGLLDSQVDGYIHCNLNAQGTVTGRVSSSAPNLQTVPRDDKIIRKMFACPDDYYMFFLDYAQQEYKVFLDYVKENEYINKVNSGLDFHTLVYEELKEYLPSRTATKTLNFMLIYGGGVKKLADMLKISYEEAYNIREAYFSRFTRVKSFMSKVDIQIKQDGYIRNRFGRKRRLASNFSYLGLNSIIQGSCADYVKNRMLALYKLLVGKKSSMVLQIHDELIFYIHKDELYLVPQIKEVMEDSNRWFATNLTTDVSWSDTSWAEKRAWKGTINE